MHVVLDTDCRLEKIGTSWPGDTSSPFNQGSWAARHAKPGSFEGLVGRLYTSSRGRSLSSGYTDRRSIDWYGRGMTCLGQIGVVADNEGVLAAQLQHHRCQRGCSR